MTGTVLTRYYQKGIRWFLQDNLAYLLYIEHGEFEIVE
jgi:hypothetical protein